MGWYLAWVLLHLGILLIGSDGIFEGNNMGSDNFWPFGDRWAGSGASYYDITEFLVYSIFPFAILIIISMVRTQEQNDTKSNSETDVEQ